MGQAESDSRYSDQEVARLYDVLNPWGESDQFYFDLVMGAGSVLDVGCGTGTILKRARRQGHTGQLTGIDPDPEMLAVAREQDGIDWHQAKADEIAWSAEFDLAIMTGHAFQSLIQDDEVTRSLAAIHRALKPGGTFAFETRNPALREWDHWHYSAPMEVTDGAGRALAIDYDVLEVTDGVVTLTENTSLPDGTRLRTDRGELRFLEPDHLGRFLALAGFRIAVQYGDWNRTPFRADSPELITLARKDALS